VEARCGGESKWRALWHSVLMESTGRGRSIAVGALIAVLSLPLGYLILTILEEAIHLLWVTTANSAAKPVLWAMLLIIPTFAGVLVAVLRRHADGHNPMFGIALKPISGSDYPWIIGSIAASLIGGLVLGPEVAMVSTGAVVGTVLSKKFGLDQARGATIGAIFAILALFVGPIKDHSYQAPLTYTFRLQDLIGAVAVGAATAGVLTVGRFLSIWILRLHGGDRPKIWILASAGFLVGAVVLAYHLVTGNDVSLVLTSGEGFLKPLLALGTASAIAITCAAKWLAYSLSMGGGFRGGPFFPAIFIGGGLGAVAGHLTPGIAAGATAAGVTAAIVYLAHPKWAVTAVVGIVLALLTGGVSVIPLTLAAALVARLLPGVRDTTLPTGEQTIQRVR